MDYVQIFGAILNQSGLQYAQIHPMADARVQSPELQRVLAMADCLREREAGTTASNRPAVICLYQYPTERHLQMPVEHVQTDPTAGLIIF